MPRWVEEFEDFSSQRGLRIHETDSDIIAEAVVAGVAKDDIDVNIEDGVLLLKQKPKQRTHLTNTTTRLHYLEVSGINHLQR